MLPAAPYQHLTVRTRAGLHPSGAAVAWGQEHCAAALAQAEVAGSPVWHQGGFSMQSHPQQHQQQQPRTCLPPSQQLHWQPLSPGPPQPPASQQCFYHVPLDPALLVHVLGRDAAVATELLAGVPGARRL